MTSHSRAESPNFQSIVTATLRLPVSWIVLLRWVRSGVLRRCRVVRPRIACLLSGHERWTARTGDWVCMRCGKLEVLDVAHVPTPLGNLARAMELPRFDDPSRAASRPEAEESDRVRTGVYQIRA